MDNKEVKIDNKKEEVNTYYYSKENFFYKREHRLNILMLIIIFVLLFYVWYCFTYHWGYIRQSGDNLTNDNSIDTSGDAIKGEKNLSPDNYLDYNISNSEDTESNNTIKIEGPYSLELNNETSGNSSLDTTPINENDLKEIKLIQESTKQSFNNIQELNIFKNIEYKQSNLIYPGLSGSYYFNLENYTNKNIVYALHFGENNPKKVNMKYKLQRNGKYIVGNENNYVSVDELSKKDLGLNAKTADVFLLEWKWVESNDDNNSTSPIERGDYSLSIRGDV